MGKKRQKQIEKLQARQKAHANVKGEKKGYKTPGSMNPHKQH